MLTPFCGIARSKNFELLIVFMTRTSSLLSLLCLSMALPPNSSFIVKKLLSLSGPEILL
jgi:hypothetical protein